jgi:energy-coupling factor transporter ATP-binding protein EcfA2
MKIRSLRLEHFRKFTDPVVLTGFTDGVNVLAESNEFGKSTLLAAIRGVLFERYVSKAASVTQMRHWSNNTSPVISLEFELPSGLYKIEKRFLHREPYARLTMPDGVIHHDEAAEEHLQGVLNFTQAGKTGSKPENVGMWAALWVTQRESVDQPGFTDSARQTIHGCLDKEVGALTGGTRGKRLLVSVRADLAKIRDGNKKPAGRYKEAVAEQAAAQLALVVLQARQHRLTQDIAEFQAIKRKLAETSSGGEEARTKQLLEEAHQKRDGAQRFEDQERAALANRGLWSDRVTSAEKEIEVREKQEKTIKGVEDRIKKLMSSESDAKIALHRAEETLAGQRQRLQDATAACDDASAALRTTRIVVDLTKMSATLQMFRDRLVLADTSQARANALIARLASLSVGEPAIVRIRELDMQLRKTDAVLQAQATNVTLTLLPSAVGLVRLDGRPISTNNVSLIEDSILSVEGIGEILIKPGVQNRETLLTRQIEENRQLRQALQNVSCDSLELAEELFTERGKCENELAQARRELTGHTPADPAYKMEAGVEALRNQISILESRLATEMSAAGLELLPDVMVAEDAVREAERKERESSEAVALARAPISALETAHTEAVRLHTQVESQKNSALEEQRRLVAARDLQVQQESAEALSERLRSSQQSLLNQQSLIQALDLSRPAETVAILDARILRFGKAIDDYAAERQSLQQRFAVLKNQIEREEGVGIEEQTLAAQHAVEQLDRQVARYKHEIDVLEFLLATLEEAEQAAKERYMAPVVKRVTPYLQMLFPGAAIHCDDQFQITGIIRELQQTEHFSGLSVGTQEQIAVLTRLAFADMLLQRGHPAAIILDDALVYSDPERMEKMFDLLTEAATRTQILILTCRGEIFTRLGGNRLRIIAN